MEFSIDALEVKVMNTEFAYGEIKNLGLIILK